MDPLRGIEDTRMSAEGASAALPVGAEAASAPWVGAPACFRRDARRRWALTCLGVDGATLGAAALASMVEAPDGKVHWSFDPWTLAFCVLTLLLFQNRG